MNYKEVYHRNMKGYQGQEKADPLNGSFYFLHMLKYI